jgi:hypothetical protein
LFLKTVSLRVKFFNIFLCPAGSKLGFFLGGCQKTYTPSLRVGKPNFWLFSLQGAASESFPLVKAQAPVRTADTLEMAKLAYISRR